MKTTNANKFLNETSSEGSIDSSKDGKKQENTDKKQKQQQTSLSFDQVNRKRNVFLAVKLSV